MLAESEDEEQIIERVAALDIGKAELVCCVRIPGPGKKRLQEVSTHSTMTRSLSELANRLVTLGIERVVMEATSDYWKPVFYLLEAHGLQPWLVNARDVKHLPGRPKTDLLTELAAGFAGWSVRLQTGLARFAPRDQRRGCAAGVVRVGGAAARLA
jgi:transposase